MNDLDGGIGDCLADAIGEGRDGCGISEEQDGGTGAAEGDAVNAFRPCQRKKDWQEMAGVGAIGLVNLVQHGCAQEVGTAMGEGGNQQRRGLDV